MEAMNVRRRAEGLLFRMYGFGSCAQVCLRMQFPSTTGLPMLTKKRASAAENVPISARRDSLELVPYDKKRPQYSVVSKDKGKDVISVCKAGCIGCGLCAKECKLGAITVENNIAHIDYENVSTAGLCAKKCPKKIITV